MKMKRILSTLLAVTLLLGALSGLLVFEVSAAPAVTKPTDVTKYPTKVYNTPEEKLSTMVVMSSNSAYELYVDSLSGEIALKEIASGNILFSNPYDVTSDKTSQLDTKKQLLSQVLIEYKDTTGALKILSSFADAAENSQIKVMKIKNGVRVEYTIGREDTRKLVPKLIMADSYENNILNPMQENAALGLIESFEMDKFANAWNKIDVNDMRLVVRLAHIQRYPFLDTYKTPKLDENGNVVTDKRGDIVYTYPVFYEFYEETANETDIITYEDMIKTNTEYSFEQMDEDHEMTGYEADDVTYPLFKLALEYYLGSDGARYARVTIDSHDSDLSRCGCGFEDCKDYYFKVEPIMWSVVERYDDKMLLICDKSLYTSAFGETTSYMKSKVREELNSKFLNTAFTEEQRNLILPTLVDNSAESTMVDFGEDCPEDKRDPEEMKNNPNVCPNTEDKIFILSRSEAYKYRAWLTDVLNDTMYCRAMGVCKSGYYWYRSPSINTVWDLMLVEKYYPTARDGIFYGNVRNENIGVRPAMWISEIRW